jgi:Uma2 family endonuclease
MASASATANRRPLIDRRVGRPTWEIAQLFPCQGEWTEDAFLGLESVCGDQVRIELCQGFVEVLPVPTLSHQLIVAFFYELLQAFTRAHAPGLVLFSGIRVKLSAKAKKPQFREPDVLYLKKENQHRCREEYWEGADLVMEVVSGDAKDRARDLVTKPVEYARARIPEYWIIDPDERFIRVLTLRGKVYKLHGEFGPGMQATSVLLPGFIVSVNEMLEAGRRMDNKGSQRT